MHQEQKEKGTIWSPSKFIRLFGEKINNEESIYYWCWKNDIPVFCPAITDGAVGDYLYWYSKDYEKGLICDVA